MSENTRASALLGYPPEARLLILNADDFGMCYAENEATIFMAQVCSVMGEGLLTEPSPPRSGDLRRTMTGSK
jgi:hypothetical protein